VTEPGQVLAQLCGRLHLVDRDPGQVRVIAPIGRHRRDSAVREDVERRMPTRYAEDRGPVDGGLLYGVAPAGDVGRAERISSRLVANSSATSASPARKPTAYGSEKA